MDIKEMTIDELEARKVELIAELDKDDADLDAIENETRSIKEELETRKRVEAQKNEIRSAVANGEGEVKETLIEEKNKTMDNKEVLSSKEYIDAYARYIKTEDDKECRALLTEMVSGGQVPVPTIVEGYINQAWERSELMSLVRRTYIRGIVRQGFELSASPAVVHTEGDEAPDEEVLTFGIVEMKPSSIKKWITISDEAMDMGGEEFLDYIYDELTYQIAKKAEEELVNLIKNAPAAATATAVGVPSVSANAVSLDLVAQLIGKLASNASNRVVVMNPGTWAAFKQAQYTANFAIEPFEGARVVFTTALPSVADATSGQDWLIVGDFGRGARANFPNGEDITLKFDDLSLAEDDLVKIVGRMYVALGLVSDKAFAVATKSE